MSFGSISFAEGDSNKITRAYFDSLLLESRYIGAVEPDTSLELYGQRFKTPVMTAALSHMGRLFQREEGMVELAQGALAAGAVMWAGMGDEAEIAAITATGAQTIKIIKPYADEGMIFDQIHQAEEHGALAVGMDIDHIFGRNGRFDNVFGDAMTGQTVESLTRYVKATKLPFVVKGVLSVQDAQHSLEAGAQGIVVSHHHGVLPGAVPPLMALPRIVAAIGGKVPIFVDCGVNSGVDAFKALALGATAVSVGRAIIPDLQKDGNKGVEQKLVAMTEELAGVMARTGCPDLAHIDPSVVWGA